MQGRLTGDVEADRLARPYRDRAGCAHVDGSVEPSTSTVTMASWP